MNKVKTRQEEICRKAEQEYSSSPFDERRCAFIAGAQWADNNVSKQVIELILKARFNMANVLTTHEQMVEYIYRYLKDIHSKSWPKL